MTNLLFDIDGTLLPLDQEVFTATFVRLACEFFANDPVGGKHLPEYMTECVRSIVENDGSVTDETRFWTTMETFLPGKSVSVRKSFVRFYETAFQAAKNVSRPDPRIPSLLRKWKAEGYAMYVVSSPIFPRFVQDMRLAWTGFPDPEELFSDVTCSENASYGKQNPAFYLEFCERNSLKPEDCLMIGNDADEDGAAAETGMPVFLLTDCLLNRSGREISRFPNGSWKDLERFFKTRV